MTAERFAQDFTLVAVHQRGKRAIAFGERNLENVQTVIEFFYDFTLYMYKFVEFFLFVIVIFFENKYLQNKIMLTECCAYFILCLKN